MRQWSRRRSVVAGVTGIVLGAGLALGGATSASAAPVGHWGDFTVSGTSKAYTGTMTMPGFPATTFTSNSRQTTVISGASTWQGPSTGPGAVYGSSRGNTYINQRPNADSPTAAAASTTRYSFATPTPAGSWSFVLGDIDADQATIAATVQGGGRRRRRSSATRAPTTRAPRHRRPAGGPAPPTPTARPGRTSPAGTRPRAC